MTKPVEQAELLALAGEWQEAGLRAATGATSNAPWYKSARHDIAHAANCLTVARELRALANQETE